MPMRAKYDLVKSLTSALGVGGVLLALAAATPALSEPQPLSGVALKKILSGKLVYLNTPYGITLPIRYRPDGTMQADAGALAGMLSSKGYVTRDSGAWWIAQGKLCQKWRNWLAGRAICYRLRKQGRRVYWRSSDGYAGSARIAE